MLIMLVIGTLRKLWQDVHGVKKRDPLGFTGVVMTVLTSALLAWAYWKSGAFSELW